MLNVMFLKTVKASLVCSRRRRRVSSRVRSDKYHDNYHNNYCVTLTYLAKNFDIYKISWNNKILPLAMYCPVFVSETYSDVSNPNRLLFASYYKLLRSNHQNIVIYNIYVTR